MRPDWTLRNHPQLALSLSESFPLLCSGVTHVTVEIRVFRGVVRPSGCYSPLPIHTQRHFSLTPAEILHRHRRRALILSAHFRPIFTFRYPFLLTPTLRPLFLCFGQPITRSRSASGPLFLATNVHEAPHVSFSRDSLVGSARFLSSVTDPAVIGRQATGEVRSKFLGLALPPLCPELS